MSGQRKNLLNRLFVALLIWLGLIFVACISVFTYTLLVSQYTLRICDDAALASVWLDANGNGVEDENELPFTGACLWVNADYPKSDVDIHGDTVCSNEWDFSDESGNWGSRMFSCYESSVFVSIKPPAGYKLSTVPVVLDSGQEIRFGIASEDASVSPNIKQLDFYAEKYRSEHIIKTNRNRFTFVSFLVASVIVSWLLAKRITRLR